MCSAAGIVISKYHNQLEGDIVEALECLKSVRHQDLFYHDVVSAAQEEVTLDLVDQDLANYPANSSEFVHGGEGWSWDELAEGPEDEEEVHTLLLTV